VVRLKSMLKNGFDIRTPYLVIISCTGFRVVISKFTCYYTHMHDSKIAIIGSEGHIGSALMRLFPEALRYDPPAGIETTKEQVNKCDFIIIAVPSPTAEDGWTCDTSIVEEIFEWLTVPLVLIKSTVAIGTTDKLRSEHHNCICFSPEFGGMSSYFIPPWIYLDPTDTQSHDFMVIGGRKRILKRYTTSFKLS